MLDAQLAKPRFENTVVGRVVHGSTPADGGLVAALARVRVRVPETQRAKLAGGALAADVGVGRQGTIGIETFGGRGGKEGWERVLAARNVGTRLGEFAFLIADGAFACAWGRAVICGGSGCGADGARTAGVEAADVGGGAEGAEEGAEGAEGQVGEAWAGGGAVLGVGATHLELGLVARVVGGWGQGEGGEVAGDGGVDPWEGTGGICVHGVVNCSFGGGEGVRGM